VLIFSVLSFVWPVGTFAQSEPASTSAIIVTPTFQEVVLQASASAVTSSITITNQTNQEQSFELFAVRINQMERDGTIILSNKPLSGEDNPTSAEVTISQPFVTILANQKLEIPFTVKNTLNLSPGGHYVSVIIRTKAERVTTTPAQSVLPAISSFLLIRKEGGEQYNLFLQKVQFSNNNFWWKVPNLVVLTFENQGNIHTIPRGQVVISDIFGRTVIEGTVNEGSQFVLPRSQRTLGVRLRQIRFGWPVMLYKITALGASDPGAVTFEQTTFSMFVSSFSILTIVGLIIVGMGARLLHHKWRARRKVAP